MDVLLEGFAQFAQGQSPEAHLLVVGEVTEGDRSKILGRAVEVLGRAERQDYWRILRAADLAVQLRRGVLGGTPSAAVADCIAARVPTIVSGVGWLGELPENVVAHVPETCTAAQLAEEIGEIVGNAR